MRKAGDFIHHVCTGYSYAKDAREAAAEFHAAVKQQEMSLVLFFCSSEYDLDLLAKEIKRLFAGVPVMGCTTAGEVGPAGYGNHSLSGASFVSGSFTAAIGLLDKLALFDADAGHTLAQQLLQRLEGSVATLDMKRCFAFMLIDGMSVREEKVAHVLQGELGRIPLIGGSAGDDMQYSRAYVYYDGKFHPDSAVIALVHTRLPFEVFRSQHFVPSEHRLVVTRADPDRRIVYEINGLPAAAEYARLIGVAEEALNSSHFAVAPVVVRIGGMDFVRSIQQANPDGSLTFYCAIEEGLVLRLARGGDLIADLEHTFAEIWEKIGEPELVLGCDCVLRRKEIVDDGFEERVGDILKQNRVVGFNSYGEQFRGLHVNQTLTGIAIGSVPENSGD